jgi:hypothetical protein
VSANPMPKTDSRMSECRTAIVKSYASWTALSALRSGAPIKSRDDIYGLLDRVPFDRLLGSSRTPVDAAEFSSWHRDAVLSLCQKERRLCVGWAAKLVNVYLKTAVYVGGLGRPGLVTVIHPPLDGNLLARLSKRFPELFAEPHPVRRIRDIADYPTYARIITKCRAAAKTLRCSLFEVEQLWEGVAVPRHNFVVHRTGARVARSGR